MVDGDDTEGRVVETQHGQGGAGEGAVGVVDGDGVVRVGGVTADVADDGEFAALLGRGEGFPVHERWDLFGQVDAVDEDVGFGDFVKGPALGRLRQVPLEDVFVRDAGLAAEVDGSAATASQGADDQDPRLMAGLTLALQELGLDFVQQEVLVVVTAHPGHGLSPWILKLPRPRHEGQSGPGIASVVSEGGDSTTGIISQKFKVE